MELGIVIIILLISLVIYISFYIISKYNEILLLEKKVLNKFEPVDESIKGYLGIINDLKDIAKDDNILDELSVLYSKLSRVRNNNRKILVLKDADFTINRVFDMYKNKCNKLKKQYVIYNNKILYAKDIYNDRVKKYNSLLSSFPYNVIAKFFKIKKLSIIDGE